MGTDLCPWFYSMWLGFSDAGAETAFRGPDGYMPIWENFKSGKPDGDVADDKDCVRRNKADGTWEDRDCGEPFQYFCETPQGISQI